MSDLGKDLVQKLSVVNPVILLDQKPDPSTIDVVYKGRHLRPGPASRGGEWTYNSKYNYVEIENPKILDTAVLDVQVSFELAP